MRTVVHEEHYRGLNFRIVRYDTPQEEIDTIKSVSTSPLLLKYLEPRHNGYIQLPDPWADVLGARYGSPRVLPQEWEVHGGWTFAAHLVEPCEMLGRGAWIGFDTNHGFDDFTTKSFGYVLDETKKAIRTIVKSGKHEEPTLLMRAHAITIQKESDEFERRYNL